MADDNITGGPSNQGFFDWAAILDAVMRENTEGRFTVAEAKAAALQRSVQEIVDAGMSPPDRAAATAKLLQDSGFSSHAVAQVTGLPQTEVDNELSRHGFDQRGAQTSTPLTTTPGSTNTDAAVGPNISDTSSATPDEQLKATVDAIVNSTASDAQKTQQVVDLARDSGKTLSDFSTIVGIAAAVIAGAASQHNVDISGVPGAETPTSGTTGGTTGGTTNTGGGNVASTSFLDGLVENLPAIIGQIAGTIFTSKAAKDAADAQIAASNRALDIFEKNAGLATTALQESTGAAIETIRGGTARTEGTLREFSDRSLTAITQGASTARQDIKTSRDQVRADLIQAYGLEKDAITSASLASSGIISAARQRSVTNILEGFGDARLSITEARDAANSIIQGSTTDAKEKVDIARGNAIAVQERGLASVRSDFQPYIDAGITNLEGVDELINNPEAQRDFLLNNPFFDEFAKQAERRLLNNQAAQGRVGSGGTQLELRNRLLEFGNQLVNTSVQQRLALVQGGITSSQFVGTAEQNVANQISQIEQVTGQTLAELIQTAGVNRATIATNAGKDLSELSTGEAEALTSIETQTAQDLATIKTTEGQNIAQITAQNAAQIAQTEANTGVNLAGIATDEATQTAQTLSTTGTNLANINTAATDAEAKLQANLGVNTSNILTGTAASTDDTLIGLGDAEAAGIVGSANAISSGTTNLALLASGVQPLEAIKFGATT